MECSSFHSGVMLKSWSVLNTSSHVYFSFRYFFSRRCPLIEFSLETYIGLVLSSLFIIWKLSSISHRCLLDLMISDRSLLIMVILFCFSLDYFKVSKAYENKCWFNRRDQLDERKRRGAWKWALRKRHNYLYLCLFLLLTFKYKIEMITP